MSERVSINNALRI